MASEKLSLGRIVELPLTAFTQTFGFIARKGAGKTYAAGKLAEEMLRVGGQVVVLDPVGVWWGLRLNPSGTGRGYNIPVLGGDHADLPIEPHAGRVIARALIDKGFSAVIDVSTFRKRGRKEFVTDFAEELFHLKKKKRSPMHFILEETQKFCPQRVPPGEQRLLGAIEDIVRLGRNYGIGATLISQRPQSVNKDILSQVEALFVFQLTGAHEKKAVREWITAKDCEEKVGDAIAVIPHLQTGEAFLWSPAWLRRFDRIKIGEKRTYDASATPDFGEELPAPRQLKATDLDELKWAMKEVLETAAGNDPKLLRKKLADAEKKIEMLERRKPAAKIVEKKVSILEAKDRQKLDALSKAIRNLDDMLNEVRHRLELSEATREMPEPARPKPRAQPQTVGSTGKDDPTVDGFTVDPNLQNGLPPRRQKILDAIGALRAFGIRHPTRSQVAAWADTTHTTSTFERDLGALRNALGLIEYPAPGRLELTEDGDRVARPLNHPVDVNTFHRKVLAKLAPRRQRILQALIDAWPKAMTRHALAERAGTTETTSTFERDLGYLRKGMEWIIYPGAGMVRAHDVLFLEG